MRVLSRKSLLAHCGTLLVTPNPRTPTYLAGEQIYKETLPEAQRTQGIDSSTWVISPAKKNVTCIGSNFGHEVALLAWPDGATCISYKICQHMAPFALVPNLATTWCHRHFVFLLSVHFGFVANQFKIWSSGKVTCIAWFQSWPPGCVTRLCHQLCHTWVR